MTELNEVKRGGERSDSTPYEYDPDLPYVVAYPDGTVACRTDTLVHAEVFRDRIAARHVIDTTPKPRVPEDAEWILWVTPGDRYRVAQRNVGWWATRPSGVSVPLEDLPDVTADTVFTVLDERKK